MYYFPASNVKTNEKSPAILILPGGGYGGLAIEHEGSTLAKRLSKKGIASFVLYYRMPFHHENIPLNDTKKAIEMIRENAKKWNINKNKVGVIGFSAGGHLASTLITHFEKKNRPDFAALIYPVISFRTEFNPGGTRNNLMGDHPSDSLVNWFSSELHVKKNTPPVFIVHAMDDDVIEVQHSQAFADSLKSKNIDYRLILYPKGGHGFGMRPQQTESDYWYVSFENWLEDKKILKPKLFSKKDYQLVWEENFDDNVLNFHNWTNEVAEPGWVNNEKQRYTNGENVSINQGILSLTAKKENNEITSARIITQNKKTFTYGFFEIKAKIPKGVGTWPAIWMLGNNINEVDWPACGEMDIMEHVGKHTNFIHSTIHNSSGFGNTPYSDTVEINDPFNTFHLYQMEWTKDYITFFVDNIEVYHYEPQEKTNENWPFNNPAFMILNVAIGGDWGGPTIDETIFPCSMQIDWVKVYQKK